MKKNTLKFILDLVMAVVIALFFKKNVLTLTYHEVAGLAVFLLFLLHLIFNSKWISAVAAKLFKKEMPVRQKVLFVIDALLLVAFLTVGITGIMISKILFSFRAGGSVIRLHFFSAALSLLLVAIHLGLHASFIKNMFMKTFSFMKGGAKYFLIILLILFSVWGAKSLATTSYLRQLVPVASGAHMEHPEGAANGEGEARAMGGGMGKGMNNGTGMGKGAMAKVQPITASSVFSTLFDYLSITVVFAFAAALIDKGISHLCRRKKVVLQK
jgi:hypothetical protein